MLDELNRLIEQVRENRFDHGLASTTYCMVIRYADDEALQQLAQNVREDEVAADYLLSVARCIWYGPVDPHYESDADLALAAYLWALSHACSWKADSLICAVSRSKRSHFFSARLMARWLRERMLYGDPNETVPLIQAEQPASLRVDRKATKGRIDNH